MDGAGYTAATRPMANKPESYPALAQMMSRVWVSFVTTLDPNLSGCKSDFVDLEDES